MRLIRRFPVTYALTVRPRTGSGRKVKRGSKPTPQVRPGRTSKTYGL
jgi:hypothetical protein